MLEPGVSGKTLLPRPGGLGAEDQNFSPYEQGEVRRAHARPERGGHDWCRRA